MDDLISRQESIHKIVDHHRMVSNIMGGCGFLSGLDKAIEIINDLPSAQKTGKWMPQDHNKSNGIMTTCVYYYPKCSECGCVGNFDMNFCPNCGARMSNGGES